MPSFVLKDAAMRFGGREISSLLNSITLNYGAAMQDATVFGDTSRARKPGIVEASAQINGFFDDTDASDKDFFDAVASANGPAPFSVVPTGGAVGDRAFFMDVHQANWNPGGSIGELLPFTGDLQSQGPLVRSTIVESSTISVSGNSTEFNLGALATSKDRMYGLVQVLASGGNGTQTLDMLIQSDDAQTFLSPASRIIFPQFTTAVGASLLFATGPVTDTWWRASWTIGGTGSPSFTVFVALGALSLT